MSPSLTSTVPTPRGDNDGNSGESDSAPSPTGLPRSPRSLLPPMIKTSTSSCTSTRAASTAESRKGSIGGLHLSNTSNDQNKPHAFRPPGPTDSRSPCPALNTLANHGYLPHDGKDIPISAFLAALQHPDTYNLSPELSQVLAKGGAILIEDSICRLPGILFKDDTSMSLHDLALHGGVEHNASIVHKNTATGQRYAPIRTDTHLLNDFIENRTTIELADVAHRRAELEHVSPLGAIHAEIARGEWALVLNVFGKAHGGKIPADFLREWLYENRFPEGWHPVHQLGLWETIETSKKIRTAMADARKHVIHERNAASDAKLAQELRSDPEES